MDTLTTLLAVSEATAIDDMVSWLLQGFYPVLFGVFLIASLGVPIPEDIPLIAAGIVLHQYPEVASWPLTLIVSLAGIMSGDLVLYSLGKRWGRDVFKHRSVSWLITPKRLEEMDEKFHRWGVWMVFFGRMFMGIRAVMCITAGVTRYPYWKFFLADFAGALVSAPFFIILGYWFATQIDTIMAAKEWVKWVIIAAIVVVIIVAVYFKVRMSRRKRAAAAEETPAESPKGTFVPDPPQQVADDDATTPVDTATPVKSE